MAMPSLPPLLLQCLLACLLLAPCRHASASISAVRALDLRGVPAAGGSAEKDADTRRQLQVQVELHHLPMRARSCRPAFDPSCELYPYIRLVMQPSLHRITDGMAVAHTHMRHACM